LKDDCLTDISDPAGNISYDSETSAISAKRGGALDYSVTACMKCDSLGTLYSYNGSLWNKTNFVKNSNLCVFCDEFEFLELTLEQCFEKCQSDDKCAGFNYGKGEKKNECLLTGDIQC